MKVFFSYLKLCIFPIHHSLNVEHHIPISTSIGEPAVFASTVGITGLLCVLVFTAIRSRKALFAVLFFLTTISISSLVRLNVILNEHRLYVAIFGLCLLLSMGLKALYKRTTSKGKTSFRFLIFGFAVAICIFYSLNTFLRNRVWKDDLTLF
jgi:hypothetical protein